MVETDPRPPPYNAELPREFCLEYWIGSDVTQNGTQITPTKFASPASPDLCGDDQHRRGPMSEYIIGVYYFFAGVWGGTKHSELEPCMHTT